MSRRAGAARPRGSVAGRPPGRVRVVAGEAGGRRLVVPAGDATRPTADRVREAVFNTLASLGAIDGALVVDPFAGSGALGIEALSRGAARAVFGDTARAAVEAVEANLAATGLADRASVTAAGAASVLAGGGPWDLVLLDPPYAYDDWPALLVTVAGRLAEDGFVVVESDREVEVAPPLQSVRVRSYGSTVVTFVRLAGAAS